MFDNFPLWPARASSTAGNVDALFIFLLIVSGMMTLLIFTAVVYFAARYRHRKGVLAAHLEGNKFSAVQLGDLVEATLAR